MQTVCDDGCYYCLDSGTCLNPCKGNEYLSGGGCVFCDCDRGCDDAGLCTNEFEDACAENICSDANCAICSLPTPNTDVCYACDAGYQLSSFPPAHCVACDDADNCPSLFKTPDSCSCHDGDYWNAEYGSCYRCHESCDTCVDGSVFGCTKCCGTEVLLPNSGYCSPTCPTGFQPTDQNTCVVTTDHTLTYKFTFDSPTTEYEVGEVQIKGGFKEGDNFLDDPFPIASRGLWFDG